MYTYQVYTHQLMMHYVRSNSVINYVSKLQLPHAVNTSHTMPTTRINWGLMLLKLTNGDDYILSEFRTYLGLRPQFSGTKASRTARYSVTVNNNSIRWDANHPRRTLQWNPLSATQRIS